ncbi:MAG: bis(5'-nucleosyl)-tetraphosphatase (symmetrical) YqeK [Christensenellales bacterium]|jgi:predicted HD superfamily hydrolase involved in NAD metabolism
MNINQKELILFLKKHIGKKRLQHSVNTAKEAMALAKKYGVDPQKAYIAGLLHDVAKGETSESLISIADEYGVAVDEFEICNPELMHGKIGAIMINKLLGIDDDEILNAIRWHTTGHKEMTILEKIIYIADIIEPGRKFLDVKTIKKLAYRDIDAAMIFSLEHVMEFVRNKGFSLHPNSIEAYNELKRNGGI